MSDLPQHILYGVGNTVTIYVPTRPSVGCTVSCYTGGGGAVFEDKTATVESIATTASSAVARGATSVALTNATNVDYGTRLWLRSPDEEIHVRSVSGTTATLSRKVLQAHASGATVESTKISYTVPAASAATKFWDGRLEWKVDDGESTEQLYVQACISTQYNWYRYATAVDWYDEEPRLFEILDSEVDAERHLDRALAEVVKRIAAATQGRAWTYLGPPQFVTATILAAQMHLYRREQGDEAREMYEQYRTALAQEIETVTAGIAPRDADLDGTVTEQEQVSMRSRRMVRG